jgi:hypothetical protein
VVLYFRPMLCFNAVRCTEAIELVGSWWMTMFCEILRRENFSRDLEAVQKGLGSCSTEVAYVCCQLYVVENAGGRSRDMSR